MIFYCTNENDITYTKLNLKTDLAYNSITGIDYDERLGNYFIISNENKNAKIIIFKKKSPLFDQYQYIKVTKLYDAISKYDLNLVNSYDIVNLNEILINFIHSQSNTNIDYSNYTLECLIKNPKSNSKIDLVLCYNNLSINYTFKLVPINNFTSELKTDTIKTYFKLYVSECLNAMEFIESKDFKNYVKLLKFLTFSFNKPKPGMTNYKKVSKFIQELTNIEENIFENLSELFLDSNNTDRGNSLYEKFLLIKTLIYNQNKYQSLNTIIKSKNLNISINKTSISYKICDIPFSILIHDDIKCIQFINLIIKLKKFEQINNECEKILLLKS